MTRIRLAVATAAAALTLTGCSGGSDTPPADANLTEAPIVENMEFNSMVEPIAPPTATPTPSPTPIAPPTVDEAQVQDDADASGMTARVQRDEAPTAANETQPAETSEKK